VNQPGGTHKPAPKPRPQRAIDARRRDAAAKVTAVDKAVKVIGRTGVPVTRAGAARLAGVSRSFTYENDQADSLIRAAQTRTQTERVERGQQMTAQQEAAWKERALNAEDRIRHLNSELGSQRQLIGDLLGRLREPDGTWLEDERNQLRHDNEALRVERNQFLRERNDLQRKLEGARANVSRLAEHRVTQLFPKGPGPERPLPAPTLQSGV
jgi:Family of unknown function (DUF6262)